VWTDLKGESLETQQQNQSFLFSQEGGGGDARLDMGKAFPLKGLCHEMVFLRRQLACMDRSRPEYGPRQVLNSV
jgi:hypothetical protein